MALRVSARNSGAATIFIGSGLPPLAQFVGFNFFPTQTPSLWPFKEHGFPWCNPPWVTAACSVLFHGEIERQRERNRRRFYEPPQIFMFLSPFLTNNHKRKGPDQDKDKEHYKFSRSTSRDITIQKDLRASGNGRQSEVPPLSGLSLSSILRGHPVECCACYK